jgi:hypothetical protein
MPLGIGFKMPGWHPIPGLNSGRTGRENPSYQGIPQGWISWQPGAQKPFVNPYAGLMAAYGSTLNNWQNRAVTQANAGQITQAIPGGLQKTSNEVAMLMNKLALGRGEQQLETLGSQVKDGFYTDQAKSLWNANLQMDDYKNDLAKQKQEEAYKQQMIALYQQKLAGARQDFQNYQQLHAPKSARQQYLEMARASKYYNKDGSFKG